MLSIITINLNNYPGLVKTAQSVYEQRYKDYEYIIIDGGSTDGSEHICKRFKPDFFVSEIDKGMYEAMNKGIRAAKGDWLMFLNSGDYLLNEHVLEHAFSIMPSIEADIFYGDIEIAGKGGNQLIHYYEKPDMAYWYSANINHQAAFYKKCLFDELGLYDLKYPLAGDHAFNIRAFSHGKRFYHLGFPLVYYDVHGKSSENFERYKEEIKTAYVELVPAELKRIVFEHKKLQVQSEQTIIKVAARLNNWYQKTGFAKKRRNRG